MLTCGGSIITRNRILTAAHCIEDLMYQKEIPGNLFPKNYYQHLLDHFLELKIGVNAHITVIAREHKLNETKGITRHKVCKMTKHPKWNFMIMNYDFAILNLCEPMMFDKGK